MAKIYAQGTFEPEIPFHLFTKNDLDLLEALGVSVDNGGDDGLALLYNENYCTTGFLVVDGEKNEVREDDLYKMLQEVINRSNGEINFITHEQAYTCDKMWKGEFGGSAVIITADDIQYDGTSAWLQRRIDEVETGDFGPDTDDTPTAPPATSEEIVEALNDLIIASNLVIQRWEAGNLAEAVNNLMFAAGMAETTLESAGKYYPPGYKSTWDYHQHGPHEFYSVDEWQQEVAAGDTILGYQKWVEHQLEPLLYETDLDGVDAIEVAGCTDTDGIVEVKDEKDAEFFSVYTHRPNEGVECICDFNTKAQAVEFAKALAARTGIPVYGNLCSIEEG